jgi:hypothetical protein
MTWKRGDRVRWWVWTGGETQGLVYGTVARVNRLTVTVRPDHYDGTIRIDPSDLTTITTDEEATR